MCRLAHGPSGPGGPSRALRTENTGPRNCAETLPVREAHASRFRFTKLSGLMDAFLKHVISSGSPSFGAAPADGLAEDTYTARAGTEDPLAHKHKHAACGHRRRLAADARTQKGPPPRPHARARRPAPAEGAGAQRPSVHCHPQVITVTFPGKSPRPPSSAAAPEHTGPVGAVLPAQSQALTPSFSGLRNCTLSLGSLPSPTCPRVARGNHSGFLMERQGARAPAGGATGSLSRAQPGPPGSEPCPQRGGVTHTGR